MTHIGFFGKTPQRGDFVRFNLPRTFVTVWDDWLQQVLIAGEETHTQNWSNIYETAPSYRFALSSDIAGKMSWAGILIPSLDKVGRRFPFCVAASLHADERPVSFLSSPPNWYLQLISLAERVNDPDYDFSQLQVELAELSNQIEPVEPGTRITVGKHPDNFLKIVADSSSALDKSTGCAMMLDCALQQFAFQYSIWETHTHNSKGATFLTNGLPWSVDGLSLFNQRWNPETGINICGLPAFLSGDSLNHTQPQHVSPEEILNPQHTDTDDRINESLQATPADPLTILTIPISTNNLVIEPDAKHDDEHLGTPAGNESYSVVDPSAPEENCTELPSTDNKPIEVEELSNALIGEHEEDPEITDEDVFSSTDWTDFEKAEEDNRLPDPRPTIEPLEIEDDGNGAEPWEN